MMGEELQALTPAERRALVEAPFLIRYYGGCGWSGYAGYEKIFNNRIRQPNTLAFVSSLQTSQE